MLLPISDLRCVQYGSSLNPSREVCISPAAQPDKWRHTVRGGSLKHPAISDETKFVLRRIEGDNTPSSAKSHGSIQCVFQGIFKIPMYSRCLVCKVED